MCLWHAWWHLRIIVQSLFPLFCGLVTIFILPHHAYLLYLDFIFKSITVISTDYLVTIISHWRIWFRVQPLSHRYLCVLSWLHIKSNFKSSKVNGRLLCPHWIFIISENSVGIIIIVEVNLVSLLSLKLTANIQFSSLLDKCYVPMSVTIACEELTAQLVIMVTVQSNEISWILDISQSQ